MGYRDGKCLNVLLHQGLILSMAGVSKQKYHCEFCEVQYRHNEEHRFKCTFFLIETSCFPDGIQIKRTQWVYQEHGLIQETFRNS